MLWLFGCQFASLLHSVAVLPGVDDAAHDARLIGLDDALADARILVVVPLAPLEARVLSEGLLRELVRALAASKHARTVLEGVRARLVGDGILSTIKNLIALVGAVLYAAHVDAQCLLGSKAQESHNKSHELHSERRLVDASCGSDNSNLWLTLCSSVSSFRSAILATTLKSYFEFISCRTLQY
jgi:hypothetical protein